MYLMSVIDDYLKGVPQAQRAELERVREIVNESAPGCEDTIGYGMPVLRYKGKYLMGFCPFKNHMSIFPGGEVVEIMGDKLKDYTTSKGTIQFTLEKPLTEALIKEATAISVAAIDKA